MRVAYTIYMGLFSILLVFILVAVIGALVALAVDEEFWL